MKGPELASLFHNCLDVRQTADGLVPLRLTPQQLDFYRDIPYGKHMLGKALSSAGITMEFITDAQDVDIRWMIDAGYPEAMENRKTTLDLYVDGELILQQKVNCPHRAWQTTRFSLPAGTKQICLVLPQTYQFVLNELLFPSGGSFQPIPKRERTLLFLCDSIGQGIGAACASSGYTIQTMLRLRDYEVINQSVGGLRYEAASVDPSVPMPEMILVQIGTNDWQRRVDRADFDAAVKAFLQKLTDTFPAVPVLLLTPMKRCDGQVDRPEMYGEAELYHVLKAHCSGYSHIRCCNGWSLMPRTAAFFADGVHPNDAGHLWMAGNVTALIQDILSANN